jgi:hypothetical protein
MSDRVNLLNPPPYEPNFVFDHLTTLMLQACGHIDVHAGAGLTLPVAISCVTRAADHWPQSHLATWAAALKTAGQQLKRLKISTPKVAVHLFLERVYDLIGVE